jgi:hypothetical protein
MLLLYLLAATIIVPVVIGIFNYSKLQLSFRFITILLLIGLGNELLMGVLSFLKINNLFAVHIYAIVEVVLLSLFFQAEIENGWGRKLMFVAMLGFCLFAGIYAVRGDNIAQFNSIPRAMECGYFAIASIWLFFEMSNYERPVNAGLYYVNGAIFFYFTSCFLIFAFSKYMASDSRAVIFMYYAHAFINAVCNLVYAIGLWKACQRYSMQR